MYYLEVGHFISQKFRFKAVLAFWTKHSYFDGFFYENKISFESILLSTLQVDISAMVTKGRCPEKSKCDLGDQG